MSIFHYNSYGHFTTGAQASTKIANGAAPTAGAGAFGTYGVRPGEAGEIVNFPASVTTLEISMHAILGARYGAFIQWYNTEGIQCSLSVFSDGTFKLYLAGAAAGGTDTGSGGGMVLGASLPGQITFNVQHHIYMKTVFSQTVGTFLLKVDGHVALSLTGLDNCYQAGANCTQLRIYGTGTSNVADAIISHLALANTSGDLPGQPRVAVTFPSADGFYTAFTPVGTGSDHKDRVNETTPNDANYNSGVAAGDKDSYFYANAIPAGSTILALAPVPRVSKADASVREIRAGWRAAATDYPGVTKAVPATPGYLQDIWQLNPATGLAFTPAQINAPMEIVYEVVT